MAREATDSYTIGDMVAYPPLQQLDSAQLRDLCLALCGRAKVQSMAREEEQRRLRDEVARSLMAHARVDTIRGLEKEISTYKTKRCCEEERLRQLELAFKSCA